MLTVGITGGIGSGKTTVCKIFEAIGIPVYYADSRAKYLMERDPDLLAALKNNFGTNIFLEGNTINRPALAKLVFNDPEKLALLNSLVHPVVAQDSLNWIKDQTSPYTLKEAALLYESGSYKQLDLIISVSAPLEVRISRVMHRDGSTREEVISRINNQWPQERKDKLADFIILNDGEIALIPQVLKIHRQLLNRIDHFS